MKLPHHCIWLPLLLLGIVAPIGRSEVWWPQWRGPNRDGFVKDFSAPGIWPERLTLKWKAEVGEGYASPIVAGDKVYAHSRLNDQETVSCLRLDAGALIWRKSYPAPYTTNPAAAGHGKGPKSTPALHNGKLYTLGISGILSCFDAETGELKWRKDFSGQFASTAPEFGTAMSPLAVDGLLIAHVGGDRDGALIAFDAETGEEKWRWAEDGPGYASPIVVELEGTKQVVTQTQKYCVGLSLATGELLWRMPFTTAYDQNIVTPVASEGMLIFSGISKGTTAIRPIKRGGQWATEQVWHNPDASMYMNSPVQHGELLFGLSHQRKGRFFCLDPRNGTTLWMSEGREGENAAILYSEEFLFLLMTDARLIVAAPDAKLFTPIAEYKVADSSTWAHPAIFDRRILIKDASTLALWNIQ
jgi:outer membrane protein assembly factor BamB